ncbi:MAG: UDP-glucose 4-epimerase GalE [Oligoflexia bacterium]|nr:UDP-glucose 4-epimerase GalE [Oligoflexia bacterium]
MARVLVAGGAGYIGSQTLKLLSEQGHTVAALDNLSTGHKRLLLGAPLFEGDIRDSTFLQKTLADFRPEVIMHFCAKALVGESVEQPDTYYSNNVVGTYELLKSIKNYSIKTKFVFSSTCSIYGETNQAITEKNTIAPMNPYAKTKWICEQMLEDFQTSYGIESISLRYFNASGCDRNGKIGETHEPETHLIPRALLHLIDANRYPFQVFGNDYPTKDGSCVRDYIHVEDIANAHLLAMDFLLQGKAKSYQSFNLGTTKGHSVFEVIEAVKKVTKKDFPLKIGPRRAGDPPFLVSGSTKAKDVLGWQPALGLEEIVQTTWQWIQGGRNQ